MVVGTVPVGQRKPWDSRCHTRQHGSMGGTDAPAITCPGRRAARIRKDAALAVYVPCVACDETVSINYNC